VSAVALEHVVKRYNAVTAVDDLSFEVPAGQLVALLGPNGAGKSTCIDIILGLGRPDSGSVSLFGKTPAQAVAAGAVGGMLQSGTLVPFLTVRELVAMVGSLYPHPLPAAEALRLAGLEELAGRRTTALSGGQAQLVRFAIALVANADLLLLDEPTVALDVEARREFWDTMRKVAARGKTVIFATHYLEEADAYADRIILIARGRIVADGAATEIKARAGGRRIRATLPGVDTAALAALPGVISADRQGDAITIVSADVENTLRGLLGRFQAIRDIEVQGADLEDAFIALTEAGR
jgi:ABC-2 type transport system ATP-binding protein